MDIFDMMEEGRFSRYFRARHKISYPGAVVHVTQHAAGAEPLFLEDRDRLYMLHLMRKAANKYNFNFLSFVFMENHLHFLIQLSEANLSRAMGGIFYSYAIYFNRKYRRKGHVFSGPFRSALCLNESYLMAASLYIHLNPVRANIVREPADYRWSSCLLFTEYSPRVSFIKYGYITDLLDQDSTKGRSKYAFLLHQQNFLQLDNLIKDKKSLVSAIGTLHCNLKRLVKRKEDILWLNRNNLLCNEASARRTWDLRKDKSLNMLKTKKARFFAAKQMVAYGYKIPELAERLNLSRVTIYNVLKKGPFLS